MKRLTLAAIGALALSGCTGAHISKPAVCDGKHRRPANVYGSILPTLPIPVPASQGAGQSMVESGPGPAPGALPAPPALPASPRGPVSGATGTPRPPKTGAASKPKPATRTSQRDIALSYFSC